jgi:hypothetical protein
VRALLPSFVAKRDEVLTEKIVFEKFMPRRTKSSILLLLDRTQNTPY